MLRLRRIIPGVMLAAAVVAAYLPALRAGFVWDDDDHVELNTQLRSAEGLRRIWLDPRSTPQYYPLVHTSFWIEYRLWGLWPAGYHAVNVALHACAALLVARVLLRLGLRSRAAWLAAWLFALHPVQVESVAWITERKNVLSAVCYLGALWAYLAYARWSGGNGSRRWQGLAFGLFVLALLSKTVTASLPAVLLLLQAWKAGRVTWRDLGALGPFLTIGAAMGGLTAWLERTHVGAVSEASFVERLLVAGRAFWFYLSKLAWPAELAFIYPRFEIDAGAWLAYAYPACALGAIGALWLQRRSWGRGPLVAGLYFGGTLVPALGFFDVYPMRYSYVADHFQYLACLGPLTLVAAAGVDAVRSRRLAARAAATAAVVVLVALGLATWRQTHIYHDRETLWRDTLAKNPGAWIAHSNLGGLLEWSGRPAEALEHFREALRIQQALRAPIDLAQAQRNVARALGHLGRHAEAVEHYRKALAIDPRMFDTHYNLGLSLEALGDLAGAEASYRAALALEPDLAEAHNNLAIVLFFQGRHAEAWAEVRRLQDLGHSAHPEFIQALTRAAAPPPR